MSDKKLAGKCGVYCGSCPIYRASHDNDEKMKFDLSFSTRCTLDKIKCEGCGAPGRFILSEDCYFRKCADEKGGGSCGLCKDYPCEQLQYFYDDGIQKEKEAPVNTKRIKEIGLDRWLEEMDEKWRCKHCDSKLVHGAKSCRVCGALVIRDTK